MKYVVRVYPSLLGGSRRCCGLGVGVWALCIVQLGTAFWAIIITIFMKTTLVVVFRSKLGH